MPFQGLAPGLGIYLATVRGDNRIPIFSSNSAAICACPHVGFSDAILQINALVSAGTEGLPGGRDFHFQNSRNALRCQPMKVAGFTTFKTGCQLRPDWTDWQKNNAKRYEQRIDPEPRAGVAESVPK